MLTRCLHEHREAVPGVYWSSQLFLLHMFVLVVSVSPVLVFIIIVIVVLISLLLCFFVYFVDINRVLNGPYLYGSVFALVYLRFPHQVFPAG